jgi:hypothetical protein
MCCAPGVQCFARKQLQDMDRHEPWVMKDPRMALAMPLWRPLIPHPVCVFVHKDPIKNAISLAANGKKSSQSSAASASHCLQWTTRSNLLDVRLVVALCRVTDVMQSHCRIRRQP